MQIRLYQWFQSRAVGAPEGTPIRTYQDTQFDVRCWTCSRPLREHGVLVRSREGITLQELTVCPGNYIVDLGNGDWAVCSKELGTVIMSITSAQDDPYRTPWKAKDPALEQDRLTEFLKVEWSADLDVGVRGAAKEDAVSKAIRLIREYKEMRTAVDSLIQRIRIL